jgi:two-component sensor histidine kinase
MVRISEAIRIQQALHDTAGTAYAQTLLSAVLMDRMHWSDALSTLLSAYRYIGGRGSEQERCTVERNIAMTYAGLGLWNDAERYLLVAEERAQRLNALREYPALLQVRLALLEARGDPAGALVAAKRLVHLTDSLQKDDVAVRIASLSTMHDLSAKQDELDRLNAENAALAGTIERARLRGRGWLAAILVLAVALAFTLRQVRYARKAKRLLRQRNERIHELADRSHKLELEREQQRLRLSEALLNEEYKDLLLKEIHHRVKNNLQVVNTLLKMQAIHLDDPRLDEAFAEAQGRVRSMALVHEHIYKVGDLNRVNVKAHVLALAEGILAYYGLKDKVRLDLQVTYDKASVETLMPLSLLLNELVTNAAKHAFTDQESGVIRIALRRMPNERCELTFSDDGHGMRHEQLYEGRSFGMELIRTLAEQLDGHVRLLKGDGTTFELLFDAEHRMLRAAS